VTVAAACHAGRVIRPRATSLVILAALAGGVIADPVPEGAPANDPVDLVAVAGRYQLKLSWTGCSPAGARKATAELRPIDGRLELELGAVRDGLPTIVVAGDRAKVSGRSEDVAVDLTWTRRGIAIAIDLDSGCHARGTARRDDVGIAACDELAALARVEVGCSAVDPDTRHEDVAAIDRERAAWGKATGKRRRAVAAACVQRVDVLRPTLVDAACLPVPSEDAPTMIEECRDLATRIDRLSRCRTLTDQARTQLRDMLGQISVHLVDSDPDAVFLARQVCLRQEEVVRELAPRLGCP